VGTTTLPGSRSSWPSSPTRLPHGPNRCSSPFLEGRQYLKDRSKRSVATIAAHRGGVQAVETGLRLLEAMVDLGPAPTLKSLAETDDLLIVSVRPGSVMPILSSATGRVFGAYMPEKLTAPLIAAETSGRTSRRKPPASPPVPTTKAGIADIFARVRKHGVAA